MQHPLTRVVDLIVAEHSYRVSDLRALLGVAASTIGSLTLGDYLPGWSYEPIPGGGGRRRVWTGSALLEAEQLDVPPLDHARYAPATLWRLGCRCEDCLVSHNADSLQRDRRAADERFPRQRRADLLELVAAGTTVTDAAQQVGVTGGQVYGYARRDHQFNAALDLAAMALCVDPEGQQCGTHQAYRHLRCRGTACRLTHSGQTRAGCPAPLQPPLAPAVDAVTD